MNMKMSFFSTPLVYSHTYNRSLVGFRIRMDRNHAVKIRWVLFMASALLLLGVFPVAQPQAASRIIVERIEPADLDNLMRDRDCQCMIVAMAAWCGPCRKELPTLINLYDRYRDRGLKMIGISLDVDGPEAMQQILDNVGVNFPFYWAGDEPVRRYNIFATPMLFFIKNGEVVERIPGKRGEGFLDRKIIDFLQNEQGKPH